MNSSLEVFTQTNSLASQSTLDGAPSITQLESIHSNGALYMVTFDHNIIVHCISDFSLLKQVLLLMLFLSTISSSVTEET